MERAVVCGVAGTWIEAIERRSLFILVDAWEQDDVGDHLRRRSPDFHERLDS